MGNMVPTDSPRLRIALLSYYLPSGSKIGVGYQVHELAGELVRRGHIVDVFSECAPVADAAYGHRHINLAGSMRTFRFATALRKEDFSSYDVLHAHTDDYWLWRRRAPLHVRTIHGSCFEEALRIRGAKERIRMLALGFSEVLASWVADETVVVSPRTRRWTPWVHRVIPNGVDSDRFRPDPTVRATQPVILFVGTWRNRKRGEELARVFAEQIRPAIPDAELWMVTQDAPNVVPDGIKVLGTLSNSALADTYRSAWLFCLPSSYEGFGIPYVEAMASGLPVVATPNVGARYVTANGQAGELVEMDLIGRRIIELLQDQDRRRELAAAGLDRSRLFSLRTVVDQYETLYLRGIEANSRYHRRATDRPS